MPFSSHQQNYLYVSSGTNRVSVGDQLALKLSISTSEPSVRDNIKHITYVVRRYVLSEWTGGGLEPT